MPKTRIFASPVNLLCTPIILVFKVKEMKKILFFISIIISVCACKQTPKLHTTSYIRYLSQEAQIDVAFSVIDEKDSTKNRKIDDAFFNDGAMERKENKIQGLFYQAIRDGKYPDVFSFRFKDGKKEYTFDLKSSKIEDLAVKDSLAHKLNGLTISWKGEPLGKNEILTALISDSDGEVAEAKIQGATAKPEIQIPGAMFSGLKNGKGTVYVVKTRTETIDNEQLTTDATIDFYSKIINVNLVEK
jgi:hypothetical protein